MNTKKWWVLTVVTFVGLFFAVPVFAGGPSSKAGKSNIGHLYLYEKNPSDWSRVFKGAWGKMQYRLSGGSFNFVFNGKKLSPKEEYTLIYYPDPWPGSGLICLGSAPANRGGNVHIRGAALIDTDLPIAEDLNNPDHPDHAACFENSTCIEGAKIWLVLSGDVDCINQKMIGWNPAEYLFEEVGIFFEDTGSVVP